MADIIFGRGVVKRTRRTRKSAKASAMTRCSCDASEWTSQPCTIDSSCRGSCWANISATSSCCWSVQPLQPFQVGRQDWRDFNAGDVRQHQSAVVDVIIGHADAGFFSLLVNGDRKWRVALEQPEQAVDPSGPPARLVGRSRVTQRDDILQLRPFIAKIIPD